MTIWQDHNKRWLAIGLIIMFMICLLALSLAGCAGTISPAWQGKVYIRNDRGGFINRFITKYQRWDRQNKLVVVDGYCASSCTMAIGMIRRSNLCVTPRAVWGFHGSYYNIAIIAGPKIENPGMTHLLTDRYTDDVRAWIESRGGLHSHKKMLYMKWPETRNYFRVC